MRVAILCNGKDLALWQRRAVENIARDHDLYVLACGDQPQPRRSARHWAYYALNLFTVRNRHTIRLPFPHAEVAIAERIDVRPIFDGNWAALPDEAIAWLSSRRIDAVVKFGLGLLRVPDEASLAIPILSFHHGDPRAYRGRPAGFWELVNCAPFIGQVVQVLSNELDSGRVVAFAETRAHAHSYRATLVEAYALSPYLLPVALRAVDSDRPLPIEPVGRNCRLPGNGAVLRFIAARWMALVRLLAYGAFVHKQWNVASVEPIEAGDPIAAIRAAEGQIWSVPKVVSPYLFYADPFFAPDTDDILIEALNRWSGKGELARIRDGRIESLGETGGHTSYPAPISEAGKHYLVPEISEWSAAGIYSLDDGRVSRVADLNIADGRLIDPTLFLHEGELYLFANSLEDGVNVLHLWRAHGLFDRFERHPQSPIRLSVRGGRMAGQIARIGNTLYRLGQDCRRQYGDGLLAFKIVELSPTAYREEALGEFAFANAQGPHTVNIRGERILFDFYRERVSAFSGIRRMASKF